MKVKKRKPLRSSVKNPTTIKKFNSRIRQEYMDADYIDKLDKINKTAKLPDGTKVTPFEFYVYFMKEWNNAEVSKQSEAKRNKFHRTAKEVKDCTDRNNKRNNDTYGIAKKSGNLLKVDYDTLKEYIERTQNFGKNELEDSLIEYLDFKQTKNGNSNTKK